MPPFAVSLFLTFTLFPLLIPARPVPLPGLAARQSPSTRMSGELVFNIVFSLALLFALLGSFAWLGAGRTVAQLVESSNRMYAALIAVTERLSDFRFSSLIEKVAAAILNSADDNTANTPRRGGGSYPIATVPRVLLQSGGFRRSGGTQGGDNPPAFTSSTYTNLV